MTLQGVGPEGTMGARPGLPRGSGGVKRRRLGEGESLPIARESLQMYGETLGSGAKLLFCRLGPSGV